MAAKIDADETDAERGKTRLLTGMTRVQTAIGESVKGRLTGWHSFRCKVARGRVVACQVTFDEQILLDGEQPSG